MWQPLLLRTLLTEPSSKAPLRASAVMASSVIAPTNDPSSKADASGELRLPAKSGCVRTTTRASSRRPSPLQSAAVAPRYAPCQFRLGQADAMQRDRDAGSARPSARSTSWKRLCLQPAGAEQQT